MRAQQLARDSLDELVAGALAAYRTSALEALNATAEFSPPFQLGEGAFSLATHQTRAACDFSQSLRKFARPMSVSGCLKS